MHHLSLKRFKKKKKRLKVIISFVVEVSVGAATVTENFCKRHNESSKQTLPKAGQENINSIKLKFTSPVSNLIEFPLESIATSCQAPKADVFQD